MPGGGAVRTFPVSANLAKRKMSSSAVEPDQVAVATSRDTDAVKSYGHSGSLAVEIDSSDMTGSTDGLAT